LKQPPYKALFVHSSNELYGADVILLGLMEERDPAIWEPTIILPNDVVYQGRLAARLNLIQVPHQEMKLAVLRRRYFSLLGFPLYIIYFITSVLKLVRMIKRGDYDIVHTNTTAVIPGAVAAKLTRRPHVWHSHEMIISPAAVRKLTARIAPAMSNVVITVSGAVQEHILSDNPKADNVRVLHNGIDVERFAEADGRDRIRREFGFSDSDIVVGTLARVSKGKGQAYLMEAAAHLKGHHPHIKYLLVGDAFVGQEALIDDLRRSIHDLGLEQTVTLAGYRTDGPDILKALDICVLPSTLPDSFPTVVLESMAAGRPVIATDWGGAKEMVVDGVTGYIVSADDSVIFADKIAKLAVDQTLRTRMAEAGLQRVREKFTRTIMARDFWKIMEETLHSQKDAGRR